MLAPLAVFALNESMIELAVMVAPVGTPPAQGDEGWSISRYLLVSKLNTAHAVAAIEQDATLTDAEVRYLVGFIRGSRRGVIVRRPTRRVTEEMVADE